MNSERLLLVGNPEGFHVGAHLLEGAEGLGIPVRFCDSRQASEGSRWLVRLNWHLRGHRPARLHNFSEGIVQACRNYRPAWLLATGAAPIEDSALAAVGKLGTKRLNYLTDDPWNPVHRAAWFLRSLSHYDHIFSPRRSNIDALRAHCCASVSYLPFAYAPSKHMRTGPCECLDDERFGSDVVFAGGADPDRVPIISALISAGFRLALYGGYWKRYAETRRYDRGQADVPTLRKAIATAKIALCLVRRANRDGHVMRSFEVPAIGACMLTEETAEHHEILGLDGEAVVYFRSIPEMIERARWLIAHDAERKRLAAAAHARIVNAPNTYQDRLAVMLNTVVA